MSSDTAMCVCVGEGVVQILVCPIISWGRGQEWIERLMESLGSLETDPHTVLKDDHNRKALGLVPGASPPRCHRYLNEACVCVCVCV